MGGLRGRLDRRALCCWLASALLASACGAPTPDADTSPVAAYLEDPAELERGRRIFLGACAGYCHAARGSGGGREGEAPDLWDCTWLHGASDLGIFETISQGIADTPMLGFGGSFAHADIWRLVAYIQSGSQCSPET